MSEVLLCERCGYSLDGIPETGNCPECGTRIIDSSPESRRPGSPWQLVPSPGSWLLTAWATLAAPRRTMRRMSITQKPAHSLLTINLLLSASLLTLAVAHMMNLLSTATGLLLVLPVLAVGIPAFTLLLRLLTMIEDRGIRFFGKQRGWRITREVSGAVCAHASIGWVIGGILVFTALSLNFGQTWGSGAGLIRRVTGLMYYVQWVPVAALGFFAGMLVFEILVYVGVRECRFANPPRRGNA